MKIALDIHGTIDDRPKLFSILTMILKALSIEIHITTGIPDTLALRHQLDDWGIRYDKVFSITDYHISIGTYMEWDERGPWIEEDIWNRTKANYCIKNEIDLTIDNSTEYGEYFKTPFLLYKGSSNEKEKD